MNDTDDIMRRLAAPFDPSEVKWKPAVVSGNRAIALAFVDARVIQDRLDDVLGTANWQDAYDVLPEGSVVCRLSIRIGSEWITKTDVGSPSEQPDAGDRMKSGFSDGLKRAAVKFGIGRYLYRLPAQWVDYDPSKKKFARDPQLPEWARNGAAPKADPLREASLPVLEGAAAQGTKALAKAWGMLSVEAQKACSSDKDALKAKAKGVDDATPH